MKNNFYKVPKALFGFNLSASAFCVYLTLANRYYFTNSIKVKLCTLAEHTGLSINTVANATKELHNRGLIYIHTRYNCHGQRTTNMYSVKKLGGYFAKIGKREYIYALKHCGSGAAQALCAIYSYANDNGRAYPSYAQISDMCGCTRRTAINSVKRLNASGLICKERYIKKINAYGHNNYVVITIDTRIFIFSILLKECSRYIVLFRYDVDPYEQSPLLISYDEHLALPKRIFSYALGGEKIDKHIKDSPKYYKKLKIRNLRNNNIYRNRSMNSRIVKACKWWNEHCIIA